MDLTFMTLEEELQKNPEAKQSDLQILREWHQKQPHLPVIADVELLLFLHSCYYRIEPAKAAIDSYFSVRTHAPELFTERTLRNPDVEQSLKVVSQVILPDRGLNGYLVSLYKLNDTDPRNYSFTSAVKVWCSAMECWIARHGSERGLVCCLDVKGIAFGHLAVNLNVMAKFFVYFQEALPVRIKGLIFINASSIIDQILTLIKPFLKKELIDMIKVCKSADGLLEVIQQEFLPSDYGGKQKSMHEQTASSTKELIRAYEEYMLKQEERLVVESKRAGKAKTESDLFGVQGSFKKLELD